MLLLLPATALLEPGAFAKAHIMAAGTPGFLASLIVNSCMAYAVNLTNFMVTKYTSALTLQVCCGLPSLAPSKPHPSQPFASIPLLLCAASGCTLAASAGVLIPLSLFSSTTHRCLAT